MAPQDNHHRRRLQTIMAPRRFCPVRSLGQKRRHTVQWVTNANQSCCCGFCCLPARLVSIGANRRRPDQALLCLWSLNIIKLTHTNNHTIKGHRANVRERKSIIRTGEHKTLQASARVRPLDIRQTTAVSALRIIESINSNGSGSSSNCRHTQKKLKYWTSSTSKLSQQPPTLSKAQRDRSSTLGPAAATSLPAVMGTLGSSSSGH